MKPALGAEISACKAEAVAICASEQTDVEFTHNDRRFLVEWIDVYGQIKEQEG